MGDFISFGCGCKFPIVGQFNTGKPKIEFNPSVDAINFECPATWQLLCDGNTKGVFQVETQLGRKLCKEVQPHNIDEFAAIVSISRPSCLEGLIDGISITKHYIERKHGREEIKYFHPALESILKSTYGLMIYQEQSLRIATDIAGFDLLTADLLRIAIGKKKTDKMAELKQLFISGCINKNIVTKNEAIELFNIIEASQRYQFNFSHAISYSINAYVSAYIKSHFPKQFFTSYLYWSKEEAKQTDEVRELVNNAKMMDIDIVRPDFRDILNEKAAHFWLDDEQIKFGFVDIKGVGDSAVNKIRAAIPEIEKIAGPYTEWSWLDILYFFSAKCSTTVFKALISIGSFDYLKISRTGMLFDYDILIKLSDKEQEWIKKTYSSTEDDNYKLVDNLQIMVENGVGRDKGISNKNRLKIIQDLVKSLKNPPYSLQDSPEWIAGVEEILVGISITVSKVDGKNTETANTNCKDIQNRKNGYYVLAAHIDRINEIKTKNGKSPGQKMAFLAVSDGSGNLESVVCFPKPWQEFKNVLQEKNTVMLGGKIGKDQSFIIDKAWQI